MSIDTLTLGDLRAAIAYAEMGTQYGAAVALGLSQPATRKRIHKVARVCGLPVLGIGWTQDERRELLHPWRELASKCLLALDVLGYNDHPG